MAIDWNEVRKGIDPKRFLKHGSEDVYLYCSHFVAAPFGEDEKEEKEWISGFENEVFAYFKETILRQMLFEDYVNGDAVPSLQEMDFAALLSLLIEGGKNGEIDDLHDGYKTLLSLKEWSENCGINGRYEKLEAILKEHGLNLYVEYYSSLKEAKKASEDKLDSLKDYLARYIL